MARRLAAAGKADSGDAWTADGDGSIPLSSSGKVDDGCDLMGVECTWLSSRSWSRLHIRRKKTFCDPLGSICIWS